MAKNSVNVNGKVNLPAQQSKGRTPFSVMLQTDGYKRLINNTLGDPKRAAGFVTAITSAVATNPQLQECDPGTILSAGLLGETLQLSPSPQLGQYYMVPYNDRKLGRKEAQFQLGYKGYIQLAIRSGQYRKLNAMAIKEGELVSYDPLNEEVEVQLIEDEVKREAAPTIGYYAMFEYLNGFRKVLYWSKEKMLAHADKYSQAFSKDGGSFGYDGKYHRVSFADYEAGNFPKDDDWMYSSYWYKDFDGMAIKTMLRQLISKWGIMSIEFQKAYEADMAVLREDNSFEYVDNVEADFEAVTEDIEPTEEYETVDTIAAGR